MSSISARHTNRWSLVVAAGLIVFMAQLDATVVIGTAGFASASVLAAGLAPDEGWQLSVWTTSNYALSGMRAAVAVAAAAGAVAVFAALRARPSTSNHHKETTMSPKVAVVYYSSTGNVHALAQAVADGAKDAGAEVRLRRVEELAPDVAIDSNPAWRAHANATAQIPVATHDDLRWADAYAFGTPARYGNVSSQLKQFIDTTAGLWAAGELADKPATAFTSAINRHGGNESTLLALYHTMFHWGSIIVAPGYTDSSVGEAGGNPYGTAHASGGGAPTDEIVEAARHQGRRLTHITTALLAARARAVA